MKKLVFASTLLAVSTGPVCAADAGDWTVRAGPYLVAPKSDNSDIVGVDDGASLGFTISYNFTENWAVELLAATPFSHDITLNADGSKVAETKHLPPTLSVQYHWVNPSAFRPYIGVGLNYTTFFDESTTGALEGTSLSLDDSFGIASQLGANYEINDRWQLNLDIRWINIETDASLDGVEIATVEIDPVVYGLNVGYRF